MQFFKNRIGVYLGIFALLALFSLTGCGGGSDDSGQAFPYASAKLSSSLEGSDDFSSASTAASLQRSVGATTRSNGPNFNHAAANVGFWNLVLAVNLFPHAANFATALNQRPVLQADGTWLWTYSIDTFTSKVSARISASGILWEARVSNSAPADLNRQPFYDKLWYSGTSNLTGTSGTWILRNDYPFDTDVLQIDWARDPATGIGNVKYELISDTDPFLTGSYIAYGNDSSTSAVYDSHYKIYDAANPYNIEIEWNSTTLEGRVLDERPIAGFNDSDWHYWDSNGADTVLLIGESGNGVMMNGSWSAGCAPGATDSEMSVIQISSSAFSMSVDNWSGNTDCSGTSDITVIMNGTFSVGAEDIVPVNGVMVQANLNDVYFTSATITPNTLNAETTLNNAGYCGLSVWTAGVAQDISATICMPLPKKDLIYVDDTVEPELLYYGLEGTEDASGYPTELDPAAESRL